MSRLDTLERNILINGGLDFFQRNFITAVNLTNTLSYLNADRFVQNYTGTVTGTPTTIRSADVPLNGKSNSSLALSCQRNASAVTFSVRQRVESLNAFEISNEVISASLWYKFPVATQIEIVISTPSVQDNYTSQTQIFSQTIAVTADDTWREAKFEAITLPRLPNGVSIGFNILLPSGTDASIVTHLITQIKVNEGYKALGFSRSGFSISEEIELAQRYFEKSYDINTNIGTITLSGAAHGKYDAGGATMLQAYFKVRKRVVPSTITWGPYNGLAGFLGNVSNGASPGTNTNGAGETTMFAQAGGGTANANVAFHWTADSEI